MPEIRDLTERRPSLAIRVDATPMYDLLLSLWTLETGDDWDTYELGEDWFRALRDRVSPELREQLSTLSHSRGALWIALMGLLQGLPEPHDVDATLEWMEAADGTEIRRCLLDLKCCYDLPPETLDAAAHGNQEAISRVLATEALDEAADWRSNLESLLAIPSDEIGRRIATALGRFRDEAFSAFEKELVRPLERDAAAKAALIPTTSASRMIELATNGVEYRLPPQVRALLLVPSVVIRPWSLLIERDGTYILCYPVGDDVLQDPDAPPQGLLKIHKALGDERRLRIVHRLAGGDATLQELADHLGVAKSTIHHHIGLLRSAGLVRVRVAGAKEQTRYGLRRGVMTEAERLMDVYLASVDPIEKGTTT
jgi:DNA-binding transcriptional ArsR family regulator